MSTDLFTEDDVRGSDELKSLLNRIDALQGRIDSLRPLDVTLNERILQRFRLDWNYHSNNIEGNSYTYGETKTFLLHGLTAQGKPLKDSLEIRGHNIAIDVLSDLVKENQPITESTIRELHKTILGEPYITSARTPDGQETAKQVTPGQYKQQSNHVRTATGEIFYFSEPFEVPAQMQALLAWYNGEEAKSELHSVVIAALLHYRFVRIHPFDDGNGRMARILMNLVLMKHGYPPAIIKTQDKDNYYRALQQADGGELDRFTAYIAEQVISSQELWISGASGEPLEDLSREIKLFKASILRPRKESSDIEENIRKTINESIRPLHEVAKEKVKEFNELFVRSSSEIVVRSKFGYSNSWGPIDLARLEVLPDELQDIELIYRWNSLKTTKRLIHKLELSYRFLFEFSGFRIYCYSYPTLTRSYSEQLLPNEIEMILEADMKAFFAQIKEYFSESQL